ncbi:MAG: hypothetical protein OEY14_02530, partial [Myxococcales bacterium]|nr:hypothetical protein [Myxococcales bacterium]
MRSPTNRLRLDALLLCGSLAAVGALGSACLGSSPEEAAADALGPDPFPGLGEDDDEGGPTHRPGQPCLVCHGEAYTPGEEIFVLAGTVYLREDDALGVPDVQVHVQDAAGHAFSVATNLTGNFMVRRTDRAEVRDRGEGEVRIPWDLEYPLDVQIERGPDLQRMRSRIYREGSCSACHQAEAGASSPGRVVLLPRV